MCFFLHRGQRLAPCSLGDGEHAELCPRKFVWLCALVKRDLVLQSQYDNRYRNSLLRTFIKHISDTDKNPSWRYTQTEKSFTSENITFSHCTMGSKKITHWIFPKLNNSGSFTRFFSFSNNSGNFRCSITEWKHFRCVFNVRPGLANSGAAVYGILLEQDLVSSWSLRVAAVSRMRYRTWRGHCLARDPCFCVR